MTAAAAEEWFMMIDTDEDGYIGYQEMEDYCVGKLAFNKDQVARAFASLDKSNMGKISREDFMDGLEEFARTTAECENTAELDSPDESGRFMDEDIYGDMTPLSKSSPRLITYPSMEYDSWTDMLKRLDALEAFENNEGLRDMYYTARDKCPHLIPKLEDFLTSIVIERKNQNKMKANMEDVLNRRQQAYEYHLESIESELLLDAQQRNYSSQMNQIKLDLGELEKVQELEMIKSKWMESEMKCKKHESRIQELIYGDSDARSTISKLKQEKLELQQMIAESQNSLAENRERIKILKNKMQEQAHLLLCETGHKQALQQDNESLRRQFDSLQKMKDDLQDEKDTLEQKYQSLLNSSQKLKHESESLRSYSSSKKRSRRRPGGAGSSQPSTGGFTSSDEEMETSRSGLGLSGGSGAGAVGVAASSAGTVPQLTLAGVTANGSRTDSALPDSDHTYSRENSYDSSYERDIDSPVKHYSVDDDGVIWKRTHNLENRNNIGPLHSTLRYSPSVTSDDCAHDSGYHMPTSDCSTKPYSVCSVVSLEGRQPERVFKVVLLGDSAVGKSSFIMRLCHNRFQAAFQPTIGVDFQVKTMLVQNTVVSLQLWDTAGQERFRAITKSYLRRVDGVILMYDITREVSFRNIRDWIQSVEEEDETPTILLLGNKTDVVASDEQPRAVKTVDGESLAREYNAMFCEVSAKKGTNVHDCCEDLTRALMKRENQRIAQTSTNIIPHSNDRPRLQEKSCSVCS